VKIELNDEQFNTLKIIKEKRQFGIFFDMGVGKTALILSLIEYLVFDKLEISNVLVIAPANVAHTLTVWQDEIKKWDNFKYFDYIEYNGTPETRMRKIQRNRSSIAIMSDALIDWWYQTFENLDMFDMIVIDESSRFKSPKAKRFKLLGKMINLEKHRVYELTGTPTPNGWEDIWSQIFLLDKGERLGKSFWKFLDNYFVTFGYKRYLSKENKAFIQRLIKDVCVFASSENIKLPQLIEEKIMLKFSPENMKMFDKFRHDYIMDFNDQEVFALSKQILINKCLQLSNGCIYYDKLHNFTVFDNTKLDFVRDYSLAHPEENILVFYPYKFDLWRLLQLPGAEAIDDKKSKDRWNQGKIKLGIISPFSFQFGGNLQSGGHTIIWFGLVWNLESYLQGNKRIWRQGQKYPVKIMYLLMANTWDEYVYKCVVSKEADQNDFLNRLDLKKLRSEWG